MQSIVCVDLQRDVLYHFSITICKKSDQKNVVTQTLCDSLWPHYRVKRSLSYCGCSGATRIYFSCWFWPAHYSLSSTACDCYSLLRYYVQAGAVQLLLFWVLSFYWTLSLYVTDDDNPGDPASEKFPVWKQQFLAFKSRYWWYTFMFFLRGNVDPALC